MLNTFASPPFWKVSVYPPLATFSVCSPDYYYMYYYIANHVDMHSVWSGTQQTKYVSHRVAISRLKCPTHGNHKLMGLWGEAEKICTNSLHQRTSQTNGFFCTDGEVGFSSIMPSTNFFCGLDVARGSFGLAVSGAGAVLGLIPSSSFACWEPGADTVLESSRGSTGLFLGAMGFLTEPGELPSVL